MHRSEKGFTMIEVLFTVAIMGIIIPVLAMTVATLLMTPQNVTDRDIALGQVQNASYWILRDVNMAKSVTLTEPGGFPLTLIIPFDMDENNDVRVDYLFDGNKLERQVYDSSGTLIAETLIAEYIDVPGTTFATLDSNVYWLTVKASKDEASEEISYEVSQRITG